MQRLSLILAGLVLALALAAPPSAQVSLPGVPVPRLPTLDPALGETLRAATATPLAELRKLRIADLLKAHRRELEAAPDGSLIVRDQVGALSPAPEALAQALAAGYTIISDETLGGLGLRLVVLKVPPRRSTRSALRQLRRMDPGGSYDYNHVYLDAGSEGRPAAASQQAPPPAAATTTSVVRIGLIDSGVDGAHPALAKLRMHRHGCEGAVHPAAHGTAVASLLAGEAGRFRGVQPAAELYAADVFCGAPAGGSLGRLALALDWMAREQVPVVNMSLVGPESVLLTGLVRRMGQRGHLMVAAVGNDGPAAPPLYPAAYSEVIGVTAVDGRNRLIPEACRGDHVEFAAPGADMLAAQPGGGWMDVRGTSYASPLVAGLLAEGMRLPDPVAAGAARARLEALAQDLGSAGRDRNYGKGLVAAGLQFPAGQVP